MVLKDRLNIVPCPSVAEVHYPIHQHFTKWDCAVPKGDELRVPKHPSTSIL
jgi:hypothetical protein